MSRFFFYNFANTPQKSLTFKGWLFLEVIVENVSSKSSNDGSLRGLRFRKLVAMTASSVFVVGGVVAATSSPVAAAPTPRASITVTGFPILRMGTQSAAVKHVQAKLRVTPRTGYFGPLTRAAVTRFQRAHGIPTTGVVAELTWAALNRSGRKYAPVAKPATISQRPVRQASSSLSQRATRVNRVLKYAAQLRGIPYRASGYSPATGFNCSSYTQYVFQQAIGKNLGGAYTVTQYNFAPKKIARSQARPGDLVFFYNYPNNFLGHVGIYAGNNKFWHAPRTGRVVSLDTLYTNKLKFVRVI